jgi:hypothetical protein
VSDVLPPRRSGTRPQWQPLSPAEATCAFKTCTDQSVNVLCGFDDRACRPRAVCTTFMTKPEVARTEGSRAGQPRAARSRLTSCMPCIVALCRRSRSEPGAQPTGLLEVTVTDRCIPLVTAACGTRVVRPVRTTTLGPGGDGSQLDRPVRPVLGDHHFVGKSPVGLAAAGWGDSNSGPLPDAVPGCGHDGGLSWDSLAPVVTARARCSPLAADSVCTHRAPAGSDTP